MTAITVDTQGHDLGQGHPIDVGQGGRTPGQSQGHRVITGGGRETVTTEDISRQL